MHYRNDEDSNPKLMRCFDNLKHEVESFYNGRVMHNYNDLIGLWSYCWEYYINDEIIMLIAESEFASLVHVIIHLWDSAVELIVWLYYYFFFIVFFGFSFRLLWDYELTWREL